MQPIVCRLVLFAYHAGQNSVGAAGPASAVIAAGAKAGERVDEEGEACLLESLAVAEGNIPGGLFAVGLSKTGADINHGWRDYHAASDGHSVREEVIAAHIL